MSSTQAVECLGKNKVECGIKCLPNLPPGHIKAPFYSDIKKSNQATSTILCPDVLSALVSVTQFLPLSKCLDEMFILKMTGQCCNGTTVCHCAPTAVLT